MSKTVGKDNKHHYSENNTNEWLTPKYIIDDLGQFDLDPCAPIDRPWNMAKNHYTVEDDGLSKEWFGRVWLNPPYGKKAYDWLEKMSSYGNGIALVFARTETKSFFRDIWNEADGLLFIEGRLYFYHPNGERADNNSGAPSVLVSYGEENVKSLKNSNINGSFVSNWMIKEND